MRRSLWLHPLSGKGVFKGVKVSTDDQKQQKRDGDGSLQSGETARIQALKPGLAVRISCQITLNYAVFLGKNHIIKLHNVLPTLLHFKFLTLASFI